MATASPAPIFVGCAGWSLPKASAEKFGGQGTHLQRYATRFNAVEINSSFYRPHRRTTYERWASSVPESFRFAVKVPKAITHTARLEPAEGLIAKFLSEVSGLGSRLGCLLVQLPPSLRFDPAVAGEFFESLSAAGPGKYVAVVCEPRHATWFTGQAEQLLDRFGVSRVVADPPPVPEASTINVTAPTEYLRLHGSPHMYYSAYSPEFIGHCAERLVASSRAGRMSWCIFDNTAAGAAIEDALLLQEELARLQASEVSASA